MIDAPTKPNRLIERRPQIEALLATYGPPELGALREKALREFMELGVPAAKHEEWRYTPLRALEEVSWEPAYGSNVYRDELKGATLGEIEAITLTFVNGQYAPELSTEHALPEGALACSLQEAFEAVPEVVSAHLGRYAGVSAGKLGSNLGAPFAQLNAAYLGEGAFVYVPDGAAVEEPIHLQFISKADHGAFMAHPRTLIVLGAGARAKIVESYLGLAGTYFTNAVTEVAIGRSAVLEHIKTQQETDAATHIATLETFQHAGSSYHAANVGFGAHLSRNDVNLWLGGEHTESRLDGVYVASGDQLADNHTRIDHAFPNCNSFEVYKGILSDRATGVFNGKIFVYEDAQKTDAKQTNQALLLSPQATINTKPQLEIFADDVKCTHGATIGQIREDALFYLRSRGIPAHEAKSLLVYAFAAEVLERISIPAVSEALEKALYEKLNQGGAL